MPKTKAAKKSPIKKTAKKDVQKPMTDKVIAVKSEKRKSSKKTVSKEPVIEIATPSEEKKEVISKYQVKEGDTGSPEVQAALLTKRIEKLVVHLKGNPADNHSRRGLLGIVSKRRRLLNYLAKKDHVRYKSISQKLGLVK